MSVDNPFDSLSVFGYHRAAWWSLLMQERHMYHYPSWKRPCHRAIDPPQEQCNRTMEPSCSYGQ